MSVLSICRVFPAEVRVKFPEVVLITALPALPAKLTPLAKPEVTATVPVKVDVVPENMLALMVFPVAIVRPPVP
jgi:hypothetical protein